MASGLLESIDRSTQLAGHNRLALLLFRLDERQIFGINVFKVQEVIPKPPLSWMPSSHELVRGVADIRGRMIPVIDLNRAIGQPSDEKAAHVIVTEYNRSIQGFLVRAVERIIHVNVEHVRPPPDGAGEGGYLTAITQYNNELVEIIDVEKVLSDVVGVQAGLSDAIRIMRPTAAFTAPAHIAACLNGGLFDGLDMTCLKFVQISGSAVPPALGRALEPRLGGGKVMQLWGMTELQAALGISQMARLDQYVAPALAALDQKTVKFTEQNVA